MNNNPQVAETGNQLPPWLSVLMGVLAWMAILLGKATVGLLAWNVLTSWPVELTVPRVIAVALLMLYVEMLFASAAHEAKKQ